MIHQIQYKWLENENSPKVIAELIKVWGTKEIVGKEHNKTILNWAKNLDLEKTYTNDEIPWCGLLVAQCVKEAGFDVVENPLWAKNWLKFGTKVEIKNIAFGDILVFTRPGGGGHVGFYIGEDETCYHVGGGNQNNMVNGTRILKSRAIGARRCDWKVSQPIAVRKIILKSNGKVSSNEA